MSSEAELRAWLNRPEQTFCANLAFGMKAWRSIEFVLISKHEIIAEEFCRNLPALRKELRKSGASETATAEAWSIIGEFLALKYSAGAISSAVKQQLVDALRKEANKTLDSPVAGVFGAMLVTLEHSGMQNFYKSTPAALADFIGTICAYLLRLIEQQALLADGWLPKQTEVIRKMLSGLLTFVKQTPMLEVFRKRFASESYVPFVELIIVLKSKGLNFTGEFFSIINEMFFPADQATTLQDFLKASASSISTADEHSAFVTMFTSPSYALALWLQAVLKTFRLDNITQIALHEFLFAHVFVVSAIEDDDAAPAQHSVPTMLALVTHYLNLLKLHECRMSVTIHGKRSVTQFFAQQIEALFALHHAAHLSEMLALLCAVLRLDGNMLEKTILSMAAQCMLLPKPDALAERRFEQFLCATIDTFRRLNRAPNFVSHVLRHLGEQLAEKKLSSRLKRKSLATNGTPAKKCKQNGEGDAAQNGDDESEDEEPTAIDYFALLQSEFSHNAETAVVSSDVAVAADWPDIAFAWPPVVAGAFVQFVGSLVSRPSFVLWKTILFTLTDYVVLIKEGNTDSSSLFLIDIASAILCQYFAGARLAEHSDQQWEQIDANRKLTHALLHEFGKAILHKEHNNRTMNAFLKCCLQVADFELVCFYYWPDTLRADFDRHTGGASIHAYLQEPLPQQWTLVQQRVTNFGRDECRANLNRLQLQRVYAAALFGRPAATNAGGGSDAVLLSDVFQVERMLGGQAGGLLAERLSIAEMGEVCELLLADGEKSGGEMLARLSGRVLRNGRFVFVLYVHVYNAVCGQFGTSSGSKAPQPFGCDGIVEALGAPKSAGKQLVRMVEQLQAMAAAGGHLKKANAAAIGGFLDVLQRLPIDFLTVEERNVLFVLQMNLYVGIKKTQNAELIAKILRILRAFQHFGTPAEVFSVLPIAGWLGIFGGAADVLPLYRFAFEKAAGNASAAANVRMFDELLALLGQEDDDPKRSLVLLDVSLALLDSLMKQKAKCKEHLARFRGALLARIQQELAVAERSADANAVRAFVLHTITGFGVVIGAVLGKAESLALIDDNVRAVFKVYLRHAQLRENFEAAVKLLNFVGRERKLFAVSDAEERALVDRFWSEYVLLLQEGEGDPGDGHAENLLKFLVASKTPEEFVDLLSDGGRADEECSVLETFCAYRHKLYAGLAKSIGNKANGILFTEFFKHISVCLVQALRKKGALRENPDAILKLLECQRIICINEHLAVSVQLVDDIIAFLSEIDIKAFATGETSTKFKTSEPAAAALAADADTRLKTFSRLHSAMSGVLQALWQHRTSFVVGRVAHTSGIIRSLLHAITFYQAQPRPTSAAVRAGNTPAAVASANASAQPPVAPLDQGAVTMIADLTHRIENVIKAFVKKAKDVQRVAPYLLLFIINLLVSDEQPPSQTINVAQIKTYVEGICMDLISACDARVESFVLRNCNEAAKQVFEQLNRDFNKYHKFRGKV